VIVPPHDANHAFGKFRARDRGGFDLEPV
jgi:hypothetical protein